MLRSALCSLVVFMLAGCPGDDGTAETGASTTEGSGGSTAGAADTAGTADAGTAQTSTSTQGSTSTPFDTGDDTSGLSPVAQACQDTCMALIECEIEDVPNCGIPCAGIEGMVLDCEDEYLAQMACVGALSCDDLQAWVDSTGDHACMAEDSAYNECVGA